MRAVKPLARARSQKQRANDTDTAESCSIKCPPYPVWPHICGASLKRDTFKEKVFFFWFGGGHIRACACGGENSGNAGRGVQVRLPASCAHLRATTSAPSRLAVARTRSTSAAGQLWKMHTLAKITKCGAKF